MSIVYSLQSTDSRQTTSTNKRNDRFTCGWIGRFFYLPHNKKVKNILYKKILVSCKKINSIGVKIASKRNRTKLAWVILSVSNFYTHIYTQSFLWDFLNIHYKLQVPFFKIISYYLYLLSLWDISLFFTRHQ